MADPGAPPAGWLATGRHHLPIRVYYEDTDAGGLVYHANHLRFAERGRTEMLRHLGLDHHRLKAEHGVVFVVRRCSVDYLAPARLDDRLTVVTVPLRLGGAAFELRQEIRRDASLLASLELRLALLSSSLRPARVPAPLRAALEPLLAAAQAP